MKIFSPKEGTSRQAYKIINESTFVVFGAEEIIVNQSKPLELMTNFSGLGEKYFEI